MNSNITLLVVISFLCYITSILSNPISSKDKSTISEQKEALDFLSSRGIKRAFDSFTPSFSGFDKRSFDSFLGTGFTGMDRKRSLDNSFIRTEFNGLNKRAFDSFAGTFNGMDRKRKRAFDSLVDSGFTGFD